MFCKKKDNYEEDQDIELFFEGIRHMLEFYMKQECSFILNFVFSFLLFFILGIICWYYIV